QIIRNFYLYFFSSRRRHTRSKSDGSSDVCSSDLEIFNTKYDYVVYAIDMVSSKIHLVQESIKRNIPIISSMGMGNKLDPTKIEVSDISQTHTCPLQK